MIYLLVAIYIGLSVLGLTFIKLSSSEILQSITIPLINIKISIFSIIGYISYICSFLLYTIIIGKFEISKIVPIVGGIVNIIIAIVGALIFKEQINISTILGIILISVGVILVS